MQVEFWDTVQDQLLTSLDVSEPITGLRITTKYLIIILERRAVCMEYSLSEKTGRIAPSIVRGVYETSTNPHGLCCVSGDTIALPGLTSGQAQVLDSQAKRKRVIAAHNSPLRAMALSKDGQLLATAGENVFLHRCYHLWI